MHFVKHVYQSTLAELNLKEQQISIVFCGDFNSVPECGIYKLMTEKFVPDDFIDFQSSEFSLSFQFLFNQLSEDNNSIILFLQFKDAEEAVKGVSLAQPFDIRSAYNNPKYTNFTVGFAACLDYIFYQADNLRVLQVNYRENQQYIPTLNTYLASCVLI